MLYTLGNHALRKFTLECLVLNNRCSVSKKHRCIHGVSMLSVYHQIILLTIKIFSHAPFYEMLHGTHLCALLTYITIRTQLYKSSTQYEELNIFLNRNLFHV